MRVSYSTVCEDWCVIIVVTINVYPVLFSRIFSWLRYYPAEDQLSSPPYTSFHAQETRCYVYMPIRALYLYPEPIVEPLLIAFVFLLRHPAKLCVERT